VKYLKIGGMCVVKSPHYSQMGPRTGLRPVGNERELQNKHPERVWRALGIKYCQRNLSGPSGRLASLRSANCDLVNFGFSGGLYDTLWILECTWFTVTSFLHS
jgi:hypothetical protein